MNYKFLAHEILVLSKEKDIPITQMKLQKLLYLINGFYAAMIGEFLVNEDFQAWEHGPVLPEMYFELKKYPKAIPYTEYKDSVITDKRIKGYILPIFELLKDKSAWELRNISCKIGPWKDVYVSELQGIIISAKSIKKSFKENLEDFYTPTKERRNI